MSRPFRLLAVHHTGISVRDLKASLAFWWRKAPALARVRFTSADQDGTTIELMQPAG